MKEQIRSAWTWGTKLLEQKGLELPRLEAEILLRSVLGWERAVLYARLTDFMEPEQFMLYQQFIFKRAEGVPSQYLTGTQEFMSLPFKVTKDVLIPRPESELLVELGLELLKGKPEGDHPVLELCTGSGAIILSLLYYLPDLRAVATDLSLPALEIARENARRLGIDKRIRFLSGDLFNPIREGGLNQKFNLVLANPPYIPSGMIDRLQREVSGYEPRLALDGGEDGLLFYRRISGELGEFLNPGGMVALEIGAEQGEAVASLLQDTGLFSKIEVIPDLAGLPRIVAGYGRN